MKKSDPKTIIRMIKQLQDVVTKLPEGVYVIHALDAKAFYFFVSYTPQPLCQRGWVRYYPASARTTDPMTITRMIKQLQDAVIELPEGDYVIQLVKLDSKSTENSLMRHIRFMK